MTGKIMFARSNIEGDIKKIIYCGDIEKSEYETKYKGHLTCIKGCSARIKFTERKNNVKFFSTWNGEGGLHTEECPYHIEYKGIIGRKKLRAYYESVELSEDVILQQIWVIAYGEITKKKSDKKGVNVLVISPNRVLVDNRTYKQIVYEQT